VDSVLRSTCGPTEGGMYQYVQANFDWVTLRYKELCDMSSVSSVITAVE
jgi:hypothetical protein